MYGIPVRDVVGVVYALKAFRPVPFHSAQYMVISLAREFVLLHRLVPSLRLAVIVRDIDEFEAAAVVSVVNLAHVRIASAARSAPACPEVEYHHLAFKRREGERLAVDVGRGEIRSGAAGAHLSQRCQLFLYSVGFVAVFPHLRVEGVPCRLQFVVCHAAHVKHEVSRGEERGGAFSVET